MRIAPAGRAFSVSQASIFSWAGELLNENDVDFGEIFGAFGEKLGLKLGLFGFEIGFDWV